MNEIRNRLQAGELLRLLRLNRGWTQEKAAEMVDRDVNTIQNWERTFRFRYPSDLHKLLRLYGADANIVQLLDYYLIYEERF